MSFEIKISKRRVNYKKAVKFMEKRVEDVISGNKPELIWILEHNSIYTGGTSYEKSHILNKKINVINTNRGGKITYHGPGQKIIYLVINLNKRKKDIRKFITNIENCIINSLNYFKIKSYADRKNIGIWIKNDKRIIFKIAAIGIRVKKWVTYHGFSINVSNNLKFYENIIPCGIKDKKVTNLTSIKKKNYTKLDKILIKNLLKAFY